MPRLLYLHGYASSPDSTKGVHLAGAFARHGWELRRLDLRVPAPDHLRLSAMIETTREAIGGPRDRAIVFGSSLGGLCAARAAARDARIFALFLLAPANDLTGRFTTRRPETAIDEELLRDARTVEQEDGVWPDVRVPTHIVHGVHDDVVDIALSRRWVAERPWMQLVEVDDGHDLAGSLAEIEVLAVRFVRALISPSGAKRLRRAGRGSSA